MRPRRTNSSREVLQDEFITRDLQDRNSSVLPTQALRHKRGVAVTLACFRINADDLFGSARNRAQEPGSLKETESGETNMNNMIKIWQIINDLLRKRKKKKGPSYFLKNGSKITNPQIISEEFNTYFANIAINLQKENTSEPTSKHFSYLPDQCSLSIYFYPTNENELINIVKNV